MTNFNNKGCKEENVKLDTYLTVNLIIHINK